MANIKRADSLEYKDSDAAQPDPPLTFIYDGEVYVLSTTASVRQNVESADENLNAGTHVSPIKAISESVLDLESNQKSTIHQVRALSPSLTTPAEMTSVGDLRQRSRGGRLAGFSEDL